MYFLQTRPYEFVNRNHLQISFEFDLNLYRIDRNVYAILDWVGDIGGLKEGLSIVGSLILALINFNTFEHYMIERLYWRRDSSGG